MLRDTLGATYRDSIFYLRHSIKFTLDCTRLEDDVRSIGSSCDATAA